MKLLLTGAFKYSEEEFNKLQNLGFNTVFVPDEGVPLQIDISDINAVVCNALFLYNDIKKFKKLKHIQLTSAGKDRVPLEYIKEKGISLHSAKGVYSIPMAEWVLLKILEIYKRSRDFYEAQRNHKWEKHRNLLELNQKTAAIIGFGEVGLEVAKRLKSFGVNVIGVGRREVKSYIIDEYYLINQIDDVLRNSDIVILTLPLTEETIHLFNEKRIANMKDNSVLINVSRGRIIEEQALIKALKGNKFLGVAIDVFEHEPLQKESELWDFDRLIVTPHNSFVSDCINERMFNIIENNLRKLIKLSY